MNLKAVEERKQARRRDTDVNVTPVLNVFLILIPFLLLTAVFVRIAVLELTLPSLSRKGASESVQKPDEVVLNMLTVDEEGFVLKSIGMDFPRIPIRNGSYDYAALAAQLKQIKEKHSRSEDVIISPGSLIKYDIIVHVMDTCRESGFPNISLSG